MFETIIIAVVSSLLTFLGTVLAERFKKSKAERDSGLVSDYLNIADMTGAQLERKINQVDRLEREIEAIKEARKQRDIETQHERDELQARLKSELIESKDIRAENAIHQKQIIKLEDMVIKMSEYIDVMKLALQNADINVPLNGALLESALRLKLSRAERERLRAK